MIVTIESTDVEEFQRVAWEYFAVRPTQSAVFTMIEDSKEIQAELLYGGLGDTLARDRVVDALVERLLGPRRRWPVNMDDERKSQKFYKDFFTAAETAGWDVRPDVVERTYKPKRKKGTK